MENRCNATYRRQMSSSMANRFMLFMLDEWDLHCLSTWILEIMSASMQLSMEAKGWNQASGNIMLTVLLGVTVLNYVPSDLHSPKVKIQKLTHRFLRFPKKWNWAYQVKYHPILDPYLECSSLWQRCVVFPRPYY